MKKLLILISILIAGYIFYNQYFDKKVIDIKESIVVTQASGMDIYSGPTPPTKYAHIKGIIKNNSDKNLSNILAKYIIGHDTLFGMVDLLTPGESAEFKTNICVVRSSNPNYTLEDINYDME